MVSRVVKLIRKTSHHGITEEELNVEKNREVVIRAIVKIYDGEPMIIHFVKISGPKGTGSLGLRELENYYKSRGFDRIKVDSYASTYQFYTKNGYKIIDHEPSQVFLEKRL